MAKESSTYWRNKRASNGLTEFRLCTNFDSFIPLSFVHVKFRETLTRSCNRPGEISCAIEILFSLKCSRMVLKVVFWRYRMPYNEHGCVSTLMNVTLYAKSLIEREKSIENCRRFTKMNAFSRLNLRLALMRVYFLVMNSKRCHSRYCYSEN